MAALRTDPAVRLAARGGGAISRKCAGAEPSVPPTHWGRDASYHPGGKELTVLPGDQRRLPGASGGGRLRLKVSTRDQKGLGPLKG